MARTSRRQWLQRNLTLGIAALLPACGKDRPSPPAVGAAPHSGGAEPVRAPPPLTAGLPEAPSESARRAPDHALPQPATAPASALPSHAQYVVIGAGMAGLAAARQLVNGGASVIVLEGRDRIGGRLWTDKSLGTPVDLGASWIHGVRGNPVAALAKRLGVATVATDYDSVTLYDDDGTALDDRQRRAAEQRFRALMRAVSALRDESEGDVPLASAIARVRDQVAMNNKQQHMLDISVNTMVEHEYAAPVERLSLQHWDDGAQESAGGDVILPGGYAQLAAALAAGQADQKPLDVRVSSVVQQVVYGSDGCTVATQAGRFTCDKVLVTLPIGVLKVATVRFEPPLPTRKLQAIARIGSGLLDKLYLRFDKPFWAPTQLIDRADLRTGRWAEFLNLQAVLGQPILLCFNAADYAAELEPKGDAEVVGEAMSVLRRLYGDAIPQPLQYLRTRWAADPFALGSYSYLGVGASSADRDALAAPVGDRLYFAGEATHRDHAATVHGAYLSGLAAATAMNG